MAHDIFISYSPADRTISDGVCARLEAAGHRCWIAPRDVPVGGEWAEAILGGIDASRAVVLVFSARANGSRQVEREVERAVSRGIPVIPLRVEAVEPSRDLAYFISAAHWVDAVTPPVESHIDRLASYAANLLGRTPAAERSPEPAPPAAARRS